jgi:hypothetical protein
LILKNRLWVKGGVDFGKCQRGVLGSGFYEENCPTRSFTKVRLVSYTDKEEKEHERGGGWKKWRPVNSGALIKIFVAGFEWVGKTAFLTRVLQRAAIIFPFMILIRS